MVAAFGAAMVCGWDVGRGRVEASVAAGLGGGGE
jgi:hypothetical protein